MFSKINKVLINFKLYKRKKQIARRNLRELVISLTFFIKGFWRDCGRKGCNLLN